MNMTPVSDAGRATSPLNLTNGVLAFVLGRAGDFTYGPAGGCGPLYGPSTFDIAGSINFLTWDRGSLINLEGNLSAITASTSLNTNTEGNNIYGVHFNAPFLVGSNQHSYFTVRVVDGTGMATDTKWGGEGFSQLTEPNASFRRMTAGAAAEGGVFASCVISDVGSALRFEFTLTNQNAEAVQVGLRYAGAILPRNSIDVQSNALGKTPYTLLPTGRPQLIQQSYNRLLNPQSFPSHIDFHWGQSNPYPGIRFWTGPTPSRNDTSQVSRLQFASRGSIPSLWNVGLIPDFWHDGSIALWWDPVQVPAGASRIVVFYAEVPWMTSDLNPPYALATESQYLIRYSNGGLNDLAPNPFQIVAHVDNLFSRIGQSIPMNNVQVGLTLPAGLILAPGETATKTIPSIDPNQMGTVQWTVIADGTESGSLTYRVNVSPGVGPAKSVEHKVTVALTPKTDLAVGPNLITMPWNFANPNFEAVLGLNRPADFQAYNWNVLLESYEVATNAVRGRGQWIVSTDDRPDHQLIGATSAGGEASGNFPFTIRQGWNLIGNPYPFPVRLNELIAVAAADPTQTLTWADLVSRNWVRSTLYLYDTASQSYQFSSNPQQSVLPGVGYWVFVVNDQPIQLFWPPIFHVGLPGSDRSGEAWVGGDNRHRLQLALTGEGRSDLYNYIGIAESSAAANELTVLKPPMPPGATLRLSIVRSQGGSPMLLTQDIREASTRIVYDVHATTLEPGTYTLAWPNIAQMPRNLRVRITDLETQQTRDMRMSSQISFTNELPGVRRFQIVIEPGSASRPVIGAVQVISDTRDANAAVTIQYSLSTEALTTIRILSPTGREVMSLTRGRADNAGANTVSWTKRDAAGRAVAPGNYIVEILAETPEGQRARVTRPVIVVR